MVRNTEPELERRRHRALADPQRIRILEELAGGGLDARELGARVGLHVNTIRSHLAVLSDAGLVAAEPAPGPGRGRPRLVYSSAGYDPREPQRLRLLAEMLTAALAHTDAVGVEELERAGEAWGGDMVEAPPPYERLGEDEAVARMVELLDELGFQPALDDPGGERIEMRPCPFLELSARHPNVICPLHLGLMRGALGRLRAATAATRLDPFVRDDLCVAYLQRP